MKKFKIQMWVCLFAMGIFSQIGAVSINTPNVPINSGTMEMRNYIYPPDYMRREPVLNYPELELFHYGNDVTMPAASSIKERGFLVNYWHFTNSEDVK
jgi:hypothetical protein